MHIKDVRSEANGAKWDANDSGCLSLLAGSWWPRGDRQSGSGHRGTISTPRLCAEVGVREL